MTTVDMTKLTEQAAELDAELSADRFVARSNDGLATATVSGQGNHAAHRPPAWRPAPVVFHNSIVAAVRMPSTINGQIAAVASSAPNREANSRPWR